jgi:hypothetical protein
VCGRVLPAFDLLGPSDDARILALVQAGLTVSAIKDLRNTANCSLADAKLVVEHVRADALRPPGPPCARCGTPLRTPRAKLCAACGFRVECRASSGDAT